MHPGEALPFFERRDDAGRHTLDEENEQPVFSLEVLV
jgi:hypothetical protein